MINQINSVEAFFAYLSGGTLDVQYLKPDPSGDIAYDFDIREPELFPSIPGGVAGINNYFKTQTNNSGEPAINNGEIVAPPFFTGIIIRPPLGTVIAACQYRTLSGGSPYYFIGLASDANEEIPELKIEGKPDSSNQIAVGLIIFGRKR